MAMPAEGSNGLASVREVPGCGVEGHMGEDIWAFGRAYWAAPSSSEARGTVLACNGRMVASFEFDDRLRPGAAEAVGTLERQGMAVEMLSGDIHDKCADTAKRLGIRHFLSELLPAGKVQRIRELADSGRTVMMVGDGLNDAPALAAARVSMAPGTAADIGRTAADLVFLEAGLGAVPLAMAVAKRADILVRQNIALAIIYNLIAVPIAILGYVTPLVAAIAMSVSSLIVIGNALRLVAKEQPRSGMAVPAPFGLKAGT